MNLVWLIQIFFVIVIVGVVYNLWRTAQAYGGLVGAGLRWIGAGMVFFSLEALDRVLGNLSFVGALAGTGPAAPLLQNLFLILGLIFSAVGFSKLTKVAK